MYQIHELLRSRVNDRQRSIGAAGMMMGFSQSYDNINVPHPPAMASGVNGNDY